MTIYSIGPSSSERFYDISLKEVGGDRQIIITTGDFESQSLTISLEAIPIARPLPYDLFYNTLSLYGLRVEEVELTRFYEGTYYSNLICTNGEKRMFIDARPSDALNIALKFSAPIYASLDLLDEVGHIPAPCSQAETLALAPCATTPQELLPLETMQKLLQECVDDENYEEALKIQALIDKKTLNNPCL